MDEFDKIKPLNQIEIDKIDSSLPSFSICEPSNVTNYAEQIDLLNERRQF